MATAGSLTSCLKFWRVRKKFLLRRLGTLGMQLPASLQVCFFVTPSALDHCLLKAVEQKLYQLFTVVSLPCSGQGCCQHPAICRLHLWQVSRSTQRDSQLSCLHQGAGPCRRSREACAGQDSKSRYFLSSVIGISKRLHILG